MLHLAPLTWSPAGRWRLTIVHAPRQTVCSHRPVAASRRASGVSTTLSAERKLGWRVGRRVSSQGVPPASVCSGTMVGSRTTVSRPGLPVLACGQFAGQCAGGYDDGRLNHVQLVARAADAELVRPRPRRHWRPPERPPPRCEGATPGGSSPPGRSPDAQFSGEQLGEVPALRVPLVSTPRSSAGESSVTCLPCSASQRAANIAVSLSPKTVTSPPRAPSRALDFIATASTAPVDVVDAPVRPK